jgi:hypothetical protein
MSDYFSATRWLLAGVLLNRDARSLTPHLWRGAFLVALFLAFWGESHGLSRRAAPGLAMLETLTWVSAVGLLALAVVGVGNVFRDEWLGNNWELLQITGVSGFDLLLAKLIPTWLTAASFLLLEIPCFLLCVTLGGVTPLQVGAVVWQLTLVFLTVSSITVLVASGIHKSGSILITVAFLMFAVHIADLICDRIVSEVLFGSATAGSKFPRASFVAEFERIFSSGYAGPVFGWPGLFHAATVCGCLVLAVKILRMHMAEPREELSVEETAPEGQAHQTTIPVWRPNYKVPRCEGNAIEWKDYHFTLGGDDMMNGKSFVTAGTLFIMSVLLAVTIQGDLRASGLLVLMTILAILGVIGSLAFSAQRLWVQEIREQTLSGLVMLPVDAKDIIHAKLRVLWRMSLPESIMFLVLLLGIAWFSLLEREWIACKFFVGLLISIPMVVCTDAAWRFLPQTWAGFEPRTKLASMNLIAWILSGSVAVFVSPLLGLALLAILVPPICHLAIDIAADWLQNHAGELEE